MVTAQPGQTTRQLGAHILPINYTNQSGNLTVALVGAVAPGQAGNPVGSADDPDIFNQLGPLILPGPKRNIVPAVGSATVTLQGAEARAQAEELEGVDVTIRIDGGIAFADAGTVLINERNDPDGAAVIGLSITTGGDTTTSIQ